MKQIIILLILITMIFAGCTQANTEPEVHWTDVELKDIHNDETYKISDFKGKKVLFETFAVWCVNCKQQQDEIKKLHEESDMDFVSVSLSSDPNEDINIIKEHINENGYSWPYSVAPTEMSEQLLNEFGFIILNAGNAPIVLFCEDGSYSLLPDGVKKKEDLETALRSC